MAILASQVKKTTKSKVESEVRDAHLPGYLMIAFGILGLGINFEVFADMSWAKAYPWLAILFGIVALVKLAISKD